LGFDVKEPIVAEENLPVPSRKSFEDLKQVNQHGAEYWTARELQPHLGYDQWRRFEDAIKRAITSCEKSGNDPDHHFAGTGKMIPVGDEKGRKGRKGVRDEKGSGTFSGPPRRASR
jgi:DNA-damage-inducible protein D